MLLECTPNLKKLSFHDVNLAEHQKEVLLLLQDPGLQGTGSSWVLGKVLRVAALGWLAFKRGSLDVRFSQMLETFGADLQVLSECKHACLCASGAEELLASPAGKCLQSQL